MIKKARSVNKEIAVGVVYFNFCKAFTTISCGILRSKLGRYGTDGRALRWAKTWLDHHAETVMVNGSHSTRRPVTSRDPQESIQGLALLSIFITRKGG